MTRPIAENGVDGTTRFEAMSKIIGHWIRQARLGNFSLDSAWQAVDEHNATLIRPSWPEVRLRREFDALLAADRRNHGWEVIPGAAIDPTALAGGTLPGPVPLSDDALVAAFRDRHADSWKHVMAWGRWLGWTGTHWKADATGAVVELTRQICRTEALSAQKPGDGRRLSSDRTIRAVERLARSDPLHGAGTDEWDAERMLLNTPGGIVDLETGELLPHDPAARMTRMTRASPGRDCPTWLRFLTEVTGGDHDLVAYLARVAGYCLTGRTSEHAFFFLHGAGANGKSVLLAVLQDVLGSYATTAPLESFMAARGERHPTDLAGLRGARLVSVTETEPGRTWAESRIKAITGGDSISVRFMHQDFFQMRPEFKLMIAGNHRPRLSGVGEAMRRRLHLVPFDVTIAPERRDKRLTDKLVAERDGILGWMLAGCAEWQRVGLAPPARVTDESASYFEDEDSFGQWIAEACTTGPEQQAPSRTLYASWSDWALASGFQPGTQRDMAEQLKARGFRQKRTPHARCYAGLAPRHRSASVPDGADEGPRA
jgi:P4 family phage/plasmid primase-like protien